MVEDMHFHLKYRNERHQGESECENYSDHATDFRGSGILLLIVQGCLILPNEDVIRPGELTGAQRPSLFTFFISRQVVDSQVI